VISLNAIDWVFFELLNINNPALLSIPTNYKVLDGLFQALAVRSGGFYVVSITSLRIGTQVCFISLGGIGMAKWKNDQKCADS